MKVYKLTISVFKEFENHEDAWISAESLCEEMLDNFDNAIIEDVEEHDPD